MYIISTDLGSTNFKAIILKIHDTLDETSIELVGKVRIKTTDFALFIYDIIDRYDIGIDSIDKIIATGTGSSFLDDKFKGIDIIKIDEFNSIAYGGLILSKCDEAIIVSIGTGTTILYSNMEETIRLGGTGLGGGTLVGLSNAILTNKLSKCDRIINFNELIDIAKKGNKNNVDLLIGDINNGNIGNMSKDITAANFAGINKKAKLEDYVAAVLNMILENIALLIKALYKKGKIVLIGTLVSEVYVKDCLNKISEFTGNTFTFVDDSEYAIAIGAWEYYLLMIRKNY